jgi:hypothetical protein
MKKSTIKNIIDQKIETINDYIQLVEIHFHYNDIVMLRMEIKKLQALLNLANFHKSPTIENEPPVNSRTILAQSGKIRDLLLQIEKIKFSCKKSIVPINYIHLLENEIKLRKIKYSEIAYDKNKTKKEFTDTIKERLRKKYIRAYLKDRELKIELLIGENNWENDNLNRIRKLIKELLYNISNIEKNSTFRFEYQPNLIAKLTATAEQLNNFYNNYIAINLLDNAEVSELPEKEKKILQDIMAVWIKNKEKDKLLLIESLKTVKFK